METRVFSFQSYLVKTGSEAQMWEDVKSLRRQVFCEEEGFGEDMVETPLDRFGIHVIIYSESMPIAAITLVMPEHSVEMARTADVPEALVGKAIFATKMVVVKNERRQGLPSLLIASIFHFIFIPHQLRFIFLILMGQHCKNLVHYEKIAAFRQIAEGVCQYGKRITMLADVESVEFIPVKKGFEIYGF
jgi:hypothetical protein